MDKLLHAHSLLVVPSDDLRGMLDAGPCGFRAPMAWYSSRAQVVPVSCHDPLLEVMTLDAGWHPVPDVYVSAGSKQALALRWKGQDMPHGWLAAGMACGWPPSICLPLTLTPQRRFLLSLEARGCTLIALDKQGKEAAP